ncbi:MAG: hypothetical protein JKY37_25035 [Nannocystaceae bacterium]|nr:hypothetical protein [Nannocystaceae bacterium]
MPPAAPQPPVSLLERLASAPHWQTAVRRAWSLARTDTRASDWVARFEAQAAELVAGALDAGTAVGGSGGRLMIGSAGVAIPPELTAILKDALSAEGPVLRAAVFMLVGAAVRAPLLPAGSEAPWDTFEKLRMIAKALPPRRRDRWCEALPKTTNPVADPSSLAGRRLIARGFTATDTSAPRGTLALNPLPRPATIPSGAAIDLLLSALTFRACAELADSASVQAPSRAA